jgi:thiol-disulfide isomerase/thioredoxin
LFPQEVNPWITLFAVDLPCLAALVVFRVRHGQIFEWPELPRFAATAAVGVLVLGVAGPVLAFNEPARVTARYEILEPGEWVGKELPILENIDIGERLRAGNWLVLLYHYDCPGCAEAMPMYERTARDLAGNENFLQIALIAVPPYGQAPISPGSACVLGKLNESKEWFVATPAVALLASGTVKSAWEENAPDFETILQGMSNPQSSSLCADNTRYQHY